MFKSSSHLMMIFSLGLLLGAELGCTSAEPPLKPRPADEDMAQDLSEMTGCPEVTFAPITLQPPKTVTQAPAGIYRCAIPEAVTDVYNLCDYGGASAQASYCDNTPACEGGCSPYNRGEELPNQGQFCPDNSLPPGQISGRFNEIQNQWYFGGRLLHRVTGASFSVLLNKELTQAKAGVQADTATLDDDGCRVGLISTPASSGEVTPLLDADGMILGIEVSITVMHQSKPETIEATIPVSP